MVVALKHKFQSAKADGVDTSLVRPSNWNDDHDLTLAASRLLGRYTASNGAAQEITVGSGLSLNASTGELNTAKAFPTGDVVGTSDTQTLTNKTLTNPTVTTGSFTNPTVTNYVETLHSPAAGSSFTVDLANGTVQKLTTNANTTITLPSSVAGKSYVIIVAYGGTHSLTFAGGSTIKWAGGTAPTGTATNAKFDIFSFFCDGTNTYGIVIGQNY